MIRKVKRPDGNQLWGSYLVDDDEWGAWLYTPKGSLARGTKNGKTTVGSAGEPTPPGIPVIHLVPRGEEWWFARWQIGTSGVSSLAVDVCLPPQLHENEWSYVDLELDLFKSSDGIVGVFDQNDFDEAVAAGHIDSEVATRAVQVAAALEQRIVGGDDLFDQVGWAQYEKCVGLTLPSLTAV